MSASASRLTAPSHAAAALGGADEEQLENDVKNMEARGQTTVAEMERLAILGKDKEKRVHQLTHEVSAGGTIQSSDK